MSVITDVLLRSSLAREFDLRHFDISDHRDISNVGRFDWQNVVLALWHGLKFWVRVVQWRPSLVHVPLARDRLGFLRDSLLLFACRAFRRPVVLHLHSADFGGFFRAEPTWMRAVIRAAIGPRAYGVVLSDAFVGTFSDVVPEDRVFVIPNGIADTRRLSAPHRQGRTVLHLSTMWREKGIFLVLEVARLLKMREVEATFICAGGWLRPNEAELGARYVRECGLESSVKFVGPVGAHAKEKLFAAADIFLFPTIHPTEGQPLVLLEALRAGVPVVASHSPAIEDLVKHEVHGYLLNPRDVGTCAKRIEALISHSSLRETMGEAARQQFETCGTAEQMAARLAKAWRRVLLRPATKLLFGGPLDA
jgi:glycosyltransferase involved in cell wall biosynthesis